MIEKINPLSKTPNISEEERLKELKRKILQLESFIRDVCYKMIGNTNEVDELVNEALYKAFNAAGQYDGKRGNLEPWLATIARNVIRDYLRKIKRSPIDGKIADIDDLDHLKHKGLNPEELIIQKEQKITLRNTIEALPDEYKNILKMEIDGLTYREMTEKLGIPEGTVKNRLFRARKELAKRMGQKESFKVTNKK